MGKFDGILICTDLDGTLLKEDKSISEENIKAIEYFKSEGGFFTIVTGRRPCFASEIYDRSHANVPYGCINGGGVFDHEMNEYIWKAEMPADVMELVEVIDREVPGAGIQVNGFYNVYFAKENNSMELFRKVTGVPNLTCDYKNFKEPVAKILFGSEKEEEILKIDRILHKHKRANDFDFIRSEQTLYEILPKGICKGMSIEKICKHLGLDIGKTVAVGNYNNDISMFYTAKVGVAVSNSCQAALDAADYITVSNEEDAIARIIYDIEEGKLLL